MSTRNNTPHDPINDPTRGGGSMVGGEIRRERAVVLSVDANRHAYRVITAAGRTFTVGRIKTHPGDNALLEPHTPVRIDFSLGEPYIDGVLPTEVPLTNEVAETITGTSGYGAEDSVMNRNLGATFRGPGEANDLLPGDQVMRSPDNASVGALHGKVAQMFGSAMAQVRAFGTTDAVEIMAGLLRVVTWMGESKYVNEDGKTSFVWRGGSDQLSETGADEERYTIRLDVGHRGDVFKFEITTPDGQPVFRFHVDPRGRLSILAADGVHNISGQGSASRIGDNVHGNREVVTEGQKSERVGSDLKETFQGNHQTLVSGNRTEVDMNDHSLRVNHQLNVSVGSDSVCNVGGKRTETIVGDDEHNVRADYNRFVTGNVTAVCANYNLYTAHAKFGRNATSHAVKHEELERAMTALIADYNAFKLLVKTHGHVPSASSPSPQLLAVSGHSFNMTSAKSTIVTLE